MAGREEKEGEKERSFNGFAAEPRIGRRAGVIPLWGRFFFEDWLDLQRGVIEREEIEGRGTGWMRRGLDPRVYQLS